VEEKDVREDRDEADQHPRRAARHQTDANREAAEQQETAGRMTCHASPIYRDTM
jgi:hypothetical protein